ncbi:MAG: hypothetical protein AAGF11_38510 [Myxococcota bacterium]
MPVESGGRLTFELDPVEGAEVGLSAGDTAPMLGGYAMVQVVEFPADGTDQIMLTVDSGDCRSGLVVSEDQVIATTDGGQPMDSNAYDRTLPLWLRLLLLPDTIHYQVSTDGVTWTEVESKPACDLSNARPFLLAREGDTVDGATSMAVESFERCDPQ